MGVEGDKGVVEGDKTVCVEIQKAVDVLNDWVWRHNGCVFLCLEKEVCGGEGAKTPAPNHVPYQQLGTRGNSCSHFHRKLYCPNGASRALWGQ